MMHLMDSMLVMNVFWLVVLGANATISGWFSGPILYRTFDEQSFLEGTFYVTMAFAFFSLTNSSLQDLSFRYGVKASNLWPMYTYSIVWGIVAKNSTRGDKNQITERVEEDKPDVHE